MARGKLISLLTKLGKAFYAAQEDPTLIERKAHSMSIQFTVTLKVRNAAAIGGGVALPSRSAPTDR
jgi:hypothetical protein